MSATIAKLIIGLTGGIGSGKSVVCTIFNELGIHISDADIAARQVVERGQPALEIITKRYGTKILEKDGGLNRAKMRQKIFTDVASNQEKLWLESLLHPLISKQLKEQLSNAQSPYAILCSPLLFESKQVLLVHKTVTVDVDEATQVARAMARDNANKDQIKAIMQQQLSRQQRLQYCDDVIDNSNTIEVTRNQVLALHQRYLGIDRATLPSSSLEIK